MLRRMYFVFALITASISFASLPTAAQSGRAFYIDYGNGSNTNNGTSKSTPWKTHPYMQTGSACTGTGSAPSYTHAAGDRFIFKGGVTWPYQCFGMVPTAGGVNGNPDYYGVDQTWYSGGSWTRPVFNLSGHIPVGAGNIDNAVIDLQSVQYLTFDNLEIENHRVSATNSSSPCDGAAIGGYGFGYITMQYLYVHDWTQPDMASGTTSAGQGGLCAYATSGPVNAYHVTVSDANGPSNPAPFGGCFRNLNEVAYSICHDTAQGEVGLWGPVHDNVFYNLTNASAAIDPQIHTNTLETLFDGEGPIYNNLIYNNSTAVIIDTCPQSTRIFNNVMWGNTGGGGGVIQVDGGGSCTLTTTAITHIYNNTIDCGGQSCVRAVYRSGVTYGTFNIRNNHFITNGTAICYNNTGVGCGNVTAVNQTPNTVMSSATAKSQGYTSSNKYAPTSSSNSTVGAGGYLTSLCSGNFASLCYDTSGAPWYGGSYAARSSGTAAWDAGAYEFSGQSQSSNPNPPTGLAALVQ